jgi:ribonuclease HI
VYAINACAVESYKNRNIYILSDSQTAIKTLGKFQISSELVWDCHQSLMQVARHKRVQLMWVSGHEDIFGDETADQLARTESEHPFTGPDPAYVISVAVAKKRVRDWTKRNHKKTLGIP